MQATELKRLLTMAGWPCRQQRDEVVLEVCYYCGNDRYNMQLSADKGVFHCWVCKRGGRLDVLLKELTGHEYHIVTQTREQRQGGKTGPIAPVAAFRAVPVNTVESASNYLQRRHLSPTMLAQQYGVVVCVEKGHRLEGRIAIPLKDYWTHEIAGWIGRSYTGQKPKYLSTLQRKTITGWHTTRKFDPAVLVEGSFDGIAVHQAGYHAAVIGGTGGSEITEWAARLDPNIPIVIMLDGNALLRAQQIMWQVRPVRPAQAVVVLAVPHGQEEDPANLGPGGVQELVEAALRRVAPTS